MAVQKARHATSSSLTSVFLVDRRDRRPGTHFAAELGAGKSKRSKAPAIDDPHVDEDLGCCEFGLDLPFLRRE